MAEHWQIDQIFKKYIKKICTFCDSGPCPTNVLLSLSNIYSVFITVYSVNCFNDPRALNGCLQYCCDDMSAAERKKNKIKKFRNKIQQSIDNPDAN